MIRVRCGSFSVRTIDSQEMMVELSEPKISHAEIRHILKLLGDDRVLDAIGKKRALEHFCVHEAKH